MATDAEKVFMARAPKYMARLMSDFPLDLDSTSAVFGNLGHESLGFTKLQEMKPTVKGSRGGWGWAQWTGPRRRAFEAYCKRTGKDPAADETNYAYLFLEMRGIEGTEKGVVEKVNNAKTLEDKVKAFELAFLRAGVKHYPQRIHWAKLARDAYLASEYSNMPPREEIAVITNVGEATVHRPTPPQDNNRTWAAIGAIAAAIIVGLWDFISKLFGG